MSTLAERVSALLQEKGLSQQDLASRVGVSQTSIAKITSGQTKRSKYLHEIARFLNVSEEWLIFGGVRQNSTSSALFPIPHIPWNSILKLVKDKDLPPSDVIEWVSFPTPTSKDLYALTVSGLSMYSPENKVSFNSNDLIFIDPNMQLEDGCCVIVYIESLPKIKFRQVILEGGKIGRAHV